MKDTKVRVLAVTTDAFRNNDTIPSLYTCEGKNIHPALVIDHIPDNTKSLAIIVDDPDAPNGTFSHWVVWNIPVKSIITENAPTGGIEGLNDKGKPGYTGPCPPSGIHRYFFKVFALDTLLRLDSNSRKQDLEKAMEGHIISQGKLTGLYKKGK